MAYTTIDDGSAYFQTALWSGDNATTQDITNDGNSDLQPDWVWVKCRNTGGNGFDHVVFDTSRGVDNNVDKSLSPSQSDSEGLGDNVTTTAQLGGVSAMLTDGFTVREGSIDNDARYVNESSRTYVGWQWKANGGTRTTNTESGNNPAGGYQANTTAGFSIVDYTGTGANGTMAHGLGAVPTCMIVKNRDQTDSWQVYHVDLGNDKSLFLDNSDSVYTLNDIWNQTTPTSSVFTIGTSHRTNADAEKYIAYCFTPIQGYSKFSSYTGNGNANGPFVYTGFKPAWLMIKNASDGSRDWIIITSEVQGYNPNDDFLRANTDGAEVSNDSGARIDFLSNGFKIRGNNSTINDNSDTHIYIAFAEHPFVSSKGVPVTAK